MMSVQHDSSSSSSLHQVAYGAVALNNDAVNYIQSEQYAMAASSLGKAIQAAKRIGLAPANALNNHSRNSSNEPRAAPSMFYSFPSKSTFIGHDQQTSSDGMFLWRRPLQMTLPNISSSSPTLRDDVCHMAGLSAYVTIYNLALCHHLQGISSSSSHYFCAAQEAAERQRTLRKALSFYKYAEKLLATVNNCTDAGVSMIHAIILLNNISHIYQLLGETASSRKYLEQLMVVLMARTTTQQSFASSSSPDQHMMNDDDLIPLDGFMASALTIMGSNRIAPAA